MDICFSSGFRGDPRKSMKTNNRPARLEGEGWGERGRQVTRRAEATEREKSDGANGKASSS